MTESVTVKTRPSLMGRLLRNLVGFALLLLVLILIFATWANHRRTGAWTFRVFDATWWGIGRDEAQPYVEGAQRAAHTAFETADELLDKAKAYLNRPPAENPPPTSTDPDAQKLPSGEIASKRAEHEAGIAQARDLFDHGVVAYTRGKSVTDPARREALRTAIADFKQVRDLLATHVPAYNTVPGKNLRILADAEELQTLNANLLRNAESITIP